MQPGENRHLAVERVTKGIALYMEQWLVAFPEQYQYWADIANTFGAKEDKKVELKIEY